MGLVYKKHILASPRKQYNNKKKLMKISYNLKKLSSFLQFSPKMRLNKSSGTNYYTSFNSEEKNWIQLSAF